MTTKTKFKYARVNKASMREATIKICACCLSQEGPLVKLVSCKHLNLLRGISNLKIKTPVTHVCLKCHQMMIKFSIFQAQVKYNVQLLQNMKPDPIKLTNNLFSLQWTPIKTDFFAPETHDKTKSECIKEEYEEHRVNNDSFEEQVLKNNNCEEPKNNKFEELLMKNDPEVFLLYVKEESQNSDTEFGSEHEPYVELKISDPSTERKALDKNTESQQRFQVPNYEGKIYKIVLTHKELCEERNQRRLSPWYAKMKYKCESCVVAFNSKEKLQQHREGKHVSEPGSVRCDICSIVRGDETALKIHRDKHFNRFCCEKCSYKATYLSTAANHYQTEHVQFKEDIMKLYKCIKCNYEGVSRNEYTRHLESHKNRQCDICHRKFATAAVVRRHKQRVHEIKSISGLRCKFCSKTFKWRTVLEAHEKRHVKLKSSYCEPCKRQFTCQFSLKKHILTCRQHGGELVKRFICDYCNESLVCKTTLRNHIMMKHCPEILLKCPICKKGLVNKHTLQRHIDFVHFKKQAPKTHICDYCGHAVATPRQLRIHIRMHTGERPLACADCGATFAHPGSYYTHRKIHKNSVEGVDREDSVDTRRQVLTRVQEEKC